MTRLRNAANFTVLLTGLALCTAAGQGALAADPQPAPSASPPATATAPVAVASKLLGLTEIESRLTAQGIRIKEIEIHDKVLEIDGYDAQNRKLELIVDRRSGEILSRRIDR